MVNWCDFGLIVAMISDLLSNDAYTQVTMVDVMFAIAVTDGCEEWSFSLIMSVCITMSWDWRQWLFVKVMGDGWQCWLWWTVVSHSFHQGRAAHNQVVFEVSAVRNCQDTHWSLHGVNRQLKFKAMSNRAREHIWVGWLTDCASIPWESGMPPTGKCY